MKRRPGFVGALVLISLGIVLLLHNAGVVAFTVTDLIRFWPALLILLGIEVLVSRAESDLTYVLGIFWAVVTIVATFALAWWMSAAQLPREAAAPRQPVAVPAPAATSAEIALRFGYGDIKIAAGAADGDLLSGEAIGRGAALVDDLELDGDVARLRVSSSQEDLGPLAFAEDFPHRPLWDLALRRDVPMTLTIGLSAGNAAIDLSELTVRTLDLGVGAGDVRLVLPSRGAVDAQIEGSAGSLTIEIPEGMPARISAPRGLGTVDAAPRFEAWGATRYQTPRLAETSAFHDVQVRLGVGRVRLR